MLVKVQGKLGVRKYSFSWNRTHCLLMMYQFGSNENIFKNMINIYLTV